MYAMIRAELLRTAVSDPREADSEARTLSAMALRCDVSKMIGSLWREDAAEESVAVAQKAIARRVAGEPLQYITGEAEFYGRDFVVAEGALIPRHDTECVVESALRYAGTLRGGVKIIDIGTGSGIIAITLACELGPRCEVLAVDVSDAALSLASVNASKHRAGGIKFIRSDLFENLVPAPVHGPFDIVVSNPPYISGEEYSCLAPEVKCEPELALIAGERGYEFYRRILSGIRPFIKSDSRVFFEIGHDMFDEVAAIAAEKGFTVEEKIMDLQNRTRGVRLWAS